MKLADKLIQITKAVNPIEDDYFDLMTIGSMKCIVETIRDNELREEIEHFLHTKARSIWQKEIPLEEKQ
jgi:hypothetical protein